MIYNYLPIGSKSSAYLIEDYINKLEVVSWQSNQFTINNTAEKYYNQINTSLLIDDSLDLYIRFFTPNMITSEDELNFYKLIGYIPLTKKYFYKLNGCSNYSITGDFIEVDISIDIYDYIYSRNLSRNYLSNVHIFDEAQTNSLSLNSNITIRFNFKSISDANMDSTNIDNVAEELMTKMNCILFDDNIIEEKLDSDMAIEFFFNKSIYNPITIRYNNLLFSENDKIAKPYKTTVSVADSTVQVEFDTAIANQILYKDLVYFIDFKGFNYNSFNFVSYSNILPANIKETGVIDGVYNHLSNKEFIYSNFFFYSQNILNSLKFRNELFNTDHSLNKLTNFLIGVLHLNYSSLTDGSTVQLTLKYHDNDTNKIVKEFNFHDKDSKYKNVMTNWYENQGRIFKTNAIPAVIVKQDVGNVIDTSLFNPINVTLNNYVPYSSNDKTLADFGEYQNNTEPLFDGCIQLSNNVYWSDTFKTYTSIDDFEINVSPENIMYLHRSKQQETAPLASQYHNDDPFAFEKFDITFNTDKTPLICTATTFDTKLSNDCDEFTFTFNFKAKEQGADTLFHLGDFIKIEDNILSVFNIPLGTQDSLFMSDREYIYYTNSGTPTYDSRISAQNIMITLRYYYGAVTVDIINNSLNSDFTFNYPKTRLTTNINLIDHPEINVSVIQIKHRTSDQGGFYLGGLDFKNRYVEDFILYDYQNELRSSGNPVAVSIY